MSNLKIESIKVISPSAIVYQRQFKSGINVFAGDNSTGKSTLLEFIAYALGYEELEWRPEQKLCSSVELLVSINEKKYSIMREVNEGRLNSIFFKDYGFSGPWNVLPYRNTKDKKSFSVHFFELLGYPIAKTEQDFNITMFQLLRLIYADQNTPPDSLFNRQKEMDNKGIRKSIYEFVIGADDLESHEIRQQLIILEKRYVRITAEISAIQSFFTSNFKINSNQDLHHQIQSKRNNLTEFHTRLATTSNSPSEDDDVLTDTIRSIDDIRKRKRANRSEIEALKSEISDSEELIGLLTRTTAEIEESFSFYSIFSGLEFVLCPQCLTPLGNNEDAEHSCKLCKSDRPSVDRVHSFYFERKKEIEFQISESKSLIEKRSVLINNLDADLNLLSKAEEDQKHRIESIQALSSEEARRISEISIAIGITMEEISRLEKTKELLDSINSKNDEAIALRLQIAGLKEKQKSLQQSRENYLATINSQISEYIINLLSQDGEIEGAFQYAKNAYLLYEDDKIIIDGATKFAASSEAVLKIAARFALFYTSLINDRVRIPKFAILDCMEDKGMQPSRAHAIQNAIIGMLESFSSNDYQIFLATSMPSDRIIEEELIVDKYYATGEHTLNFS